MANHLRLEIDNTGSEPHSLKRRDGGDPPGGDMLIRVQRLEDDMKEVKADIKALRADVSELKGRVAMLPGYGGIALIVGVIVALSTLVQVATRLLPPSG